MTTATTARAEAVARLVVLPLAASTLLVWWAAGNGFSEPGGEDYIFRIPIAEQHAAAFGLAGLAIALGAIASLAAYRPRAGWQPAGVALFSTAIGAVIGTALRVMTATVHGANIGGGMAIMLGPFVVLPALVAAVAWACATASL